MTHLLARLHRDERGGSLVESLVASALLGIALAVLMGSFATFALGGSEARQVAVAQAAARAQAVRLKAAPYVPAGDYNSYLDPLPGGLSRSLVTDWWDGTSSWVGTANANGLERLTLTIRFDGKPVATLELVKADR